DLMPTYDVECACEDGEIHSAFFPIKEGVPKVCPDCGEAMVQHLPNPPVHGVGGNAARRT
ncbi:hypothetical protein, partial [Salmonella enterica]|uniref:hypothetical protein n=1 Tax=Salmonella enterica TaxID=28901 RepID=UPI0021B48A02